MSSIQKILESKYFQIATGFFIIYSSLYDLKGEFGEIQKEHLNLLIGIIIFWNSLDGFISGTNKILDTTKNNGIKKEPGTFRRYINSGGYFLFTGIVLIAGSVYDIYDDLLNIRKEHLELFVGILYIISSVANIRGAGKKIKSGIHKNRINLIILSIWLYV